MPRLEGKVALISGGARGQGAVEARMFAEEGASVVIGDILDEQGRQTEAELQELGYNVTFRPPGRHQRIRLGRGGTVRHRHLRQAGHPAQQRRHPDSQEH